MKMKTLRKMNSVPLDIIERWLKDEDCDVRQAAMNACNGREVGACGLHSLQGNTNTLRVRIKQENMLYLAFSEVNGAFRWLRLHSLKYLLRNERSA